MVPQPTEMIPYERRQRISGACASANPFSFSYFFFTSKFFSRRILYAARAPADLRRDSQSVRARRHHGPPAHSCRFRDGLITASSRDKENAERLPCIGADRDPEGRHAQRNYNNYAL